MTQISARDFNRDVSAAKRAARLEPVFITDRGDPSFVLISIEEYRRLSQRGRTTNLMDALQMSDEDYVELDIPPRTIEPMREIEW